MAFGGYLLEFVVMGIVLLLASLPHEEMGSATAVHYDHLNNYSGSSWYYFPTGLVVEAFGCSAVPWLLILYYVSTRWFIGNSNMNWFWSGVFSFLWHLVF